MKPAIKLTQVTMDELQAILDRAKATLGEDDYEKLKAVVDSYAYLTDLVKNKDTTIKRLRQMLFGSSTEKTVAVIKKEEEEDQAESPPATNEDSRAPPEKTDSFVETPVS